MKRCVVGFAGLLCLAVLPGFAGARRRLEVYPEVIAPIAADWQEAIDGAFLKTVVEETARIVQEGAKAEEAHYEFLQLVRMPRLWGRYEPHPLLSRLFPDVTFYNLLSAQTLPETRYLKGYANGRFYSLPYGFNHLLLDHGLEVNDKNILDLAKAFVIIALMDDYGKAPKITILEGRRIREFDREWYVEWDVEIKCRFGDTKDVQTWKFSTSSARKGQFSSVDVFINNKRVRAYQVKTYEKEKRGELDEQPKVIIVTTIGNATVEQDSFFYLLTEYDGEPTNYSVSCSLYNFQPNEQNVYIRIKPIEGYPETAGPNDTLGPVSIDGNGKGFYNWTPGFEIKTGIGKVFAGNMPPGDTFRRRTPREEDKWLTLEKVVTGRFPGSVDSFALLFS